MPSRVGRSSSADVESQQLPPLAAAQQQRTFPTPPSTRRPVGSRDSSASEKSQKESPNALPRRSSSRSSRFSPSKNDSIEATSAKLTSESKVGSFTSDKRTSMRETRVKEKTYDVNLVTAEMPEYEPLLDKSLCDYFRNPAVRDNLVKLGIIDDNGVIIDKKKFKFTQLELDKVEKNLKLCEIAENRELDREVEVTIRKKIEISSKQTVKCLPPPEPPNTSSSRRRSQSTPTETDDRFFRNKKQAGTSQKPPPHSCAAAYGVHRSSTDHCVRSKNTVSRLPSISIASDISTDPVFEFHGRKVPSCNAVGYSDDSFFGDSLVSIEASSTDVSALINSLDSRIRRALGYLNDSKPGLAESVLVPTLHDIKTASVNLEPDDELFQLFARAYLVMAMTCHALNTPQSCEVALLAAFHYGSKFPDLLNEIVNFKNSLSNDDMYVQ